MWAAKNDDSSKVQGSRPSGLERKKRLELMILSSNRRKYSPLSPLTGKAIEERKWMYRSKDFKTQPTNPKYDRGPVSHIAQNFGRRVVGSNAVYSSEPALETENSIQESKVYNVEVTESNELCSPIAKARAISLEEKGADNYSLKENENRDVESTATTWYTPIGTQGPTPEKRRQGQGLDTGGKSLQSTMKALFLTDDAALHTVVDAKNCNSSTEKEGTEPKGTAVEIDNIDSGIEVIEMEISRLTQKLAELKLQKANCEVQSRTVDGKHHFVKIDTPPTVVNNVETKYSLQQGSSEKKKKGRIVSSKFLQCDSRYQTKYEQKIIETNSTGKINSIEAPQTERSAVTLGSSGCQMCRTPSKRSNAKDDKFKQQNDKVDEKQNTERNDLPMDAMGELGSPKRFDGKENISQKSASPLEKKLNFCAHSKSKEVNIIPLEKKNIFCIHSMSKAIGPIPLQRKHKFCKHSESKEVSMDNRMQGKNQSKNLEGRKPVHENCKMLSKLSKNKKSQKVSSSDLVGPYSKVQPIHQAGKGSSSFKHTRIVPSRYGQSVTPNKDASSSTQSPANLRSLRNAHGKRISSEMEVDDLKCRVAKCFAKRPALGCVAYRSTSKDFTTRNGYPNRFGLIADSRSPQKTAMSNYRIQTSTTPNSRTPQKLSERIETKKTPSPCFKDGKKAHKLSRAVPVRQGLRAKKQQPLCVKQREHSKRSQTTSAERSINKPSDQYSQSCLEGSISSVNQEKVPHVCTREVCSIAFLSSDSLEPERTRLPKISTFKFTAISPRDSGHIKRAVDQLGRHPFSSADGTASTKSIEKGMNLTIMSKSSTVEIDEIKQRLSFENETDAVDLQGFWHIVKAL